MKIYSILLKIPLIPAFNCNGIDILNIDLNTINFDNNFDENDPDAIVLIRILAWHIIFQKHKEL